MMLGCFPLNVRCVGHVLRICLGCVADVFGCVGDDLSVMVGCFWNDFAIPFCLPDPSNIIFQA